MRPALAGRALTSGAGPSVLRLVALIALSATIAPVSGCTPGGGPPPVTGVPTAAPSVTDPWAVLRDAQASCQSTALGPVKVTGSPVKAITAVDDCAVLLTRIDNSVWIWSPGGAASFPGVQVSVLLSFLFPVPGGFWVAAYDADRERPFLRLLRSSGSAEVVLPADLIEIDAAAAYGDGVIIGGSVRAPGYSTPEPDSVLLAVAADGTVTTLRRFAHSTIAGIAADGARIAVGVIDRGVVKVSHTSGDQWQETSFGPGGSIPGIVMDGDTVVVLYHEQQSGAVVAMVTETSRDGGATWTPTRDPDAYGGGLLGFWDHVPVGNLAMPGSQVSLFTLSESNHWEPLGKAPLTDPESAVLAEMAPCGVWVAQDGTFSHVPLSDTCQPG